MIHRAAGRWPVALALACALAAPSPARATLPVSAWDRGAGRLDTLGAEDRLDEAIALARLRSRLVRDGFAPAWRAAEATAVERSLSRRASLPRGARGALAQADRQLLDARRELDVDQLQTALDLCGSAWRARLALLGSGDVATLDAGLALARVQFAAARVRAADSLATMLRTGYERALGPRSPRIADVEELLGQLLKNFRGLAAYEAAIGHYEQAMRVRAATEGPTSAGMAATLHEMGNLHRVAGHTGEALALFSQALELRRMRFGRVHDDVASSLGAMAFLRSSRGRWSEAEELARAAIAATPPDREASSRSRATRLGLRGTMLRRMGRYAEAVPVLEQAVALAETLWARSPRDAGSTFVTGLSLHRDLAVALVETGHGETALEHFDRAGARLLAERLLGRPALAADPWRGLAPRLRRTLAPDEAVLGWTRFPGLPYPADYPVWAFVVRARAPVKWFRLERLAPIGPDGHTIREMLWFDAVATAAWPLRATDTGPIDRLAHLMWRERFAPLEPALAGVRRLLVCSPDFFTGGALGVLRDDAGRYLCDRFEIVYEPSMLIALRATERRTARRPPGTRPALLVGDPAYPGTGPEGWNALAGSRSEIAAIATRFPAQTVLTGTAASASRLRSLAATGALSRFGVLHFAAHAQADVARPLESALVLAPDEAGGHEASRLSAREILETWRLDADLVSLAACRSVVGVYSASEGSLGLQAAMLAAGARSLLVALWPVDDRATALLMEDFYTRISDPARPRGLAEALRESQLALRSWRDPDGSCPFAHPAYWGAFALVGDPD